MSFSFPEGKARGVSLFGFDDQGNRVVWDLAAKP